MNVTGKKSIKLKIFLVMISILLFNSLFILLFGNFFMELYYNVTTSMELDHYGKMIYSAYQSDPNSINTVLNELEDKNTVILIYSTKGGEKAVTYMSRPGGKKGGITGGGITGGPILDILNRYLSEINVQDLKIGQSVVIGARGEGHMTISLRMKLEEGVYLFAETPKAYLQDISQRAIAFTAIISGLTFFIGGIIIFLLSGAITAPIRRIQDTADEIANLNFANRCDEKSGDELALLAHSINNMSDRLQANINQLTVTNESLKEELIQKEKMECNRREFIANVSHDFKTPLTLIISYCEALKEQIEQGEQPDKEYCDIIRDEGERMSFMVQQLLRLSQLESSTITLERSIFAINEIIDGVINKGKIMAAQKNVTVNTRFEDSFVVDADFIRTEQVFTNLFDNAVKYCNEGGVMNVTVQKREEKCRILIENSGEQIKEEDIENLFHSFYKADKSRNMEGTSYGLGLAIVKAIMQLHKENYGVENTQIGVRFFFELPCIHLEEEEK